MRGLDKRLAIQNIKRALVETNLANLGSKTQGKVRDVYDMGNDTLALVATDRQSAFNKVLARIPFKAQVLNLLAAWWFEQTCDIVANHLIAVPHPNVTIARKIKSIPVEMVIRGYNTGSTETSVWTAYAKGEREFCGNTLPDDMVKNQPFDHPIITPTAKSERDEATSGKEIVEQGILTQAQWDKIARVTQELFARGQEIARKAGLILVDTKYEFGYDEDGSLVLIDEIHTPDSSRFWILKTYEARFAAGKEPESVDKEFLRLWFTDRCDPYKDELPEAPDDLVAKMAQLYVDCYQRLTGQEFVPYIGDDLEGEIAASLEFFRSEKLAELEATTIEVVIGSRSDLNQVRNAIRFFKALEQMTVVTNVCSCHRNPEELRGYALRVGGAGHVLTVDAIISAAGKAAQLPPVLKSWLVANQKQQLPVFGVALKGTTEQADQAAILSINEVPSKPVEMADDDNPFFGQNGMFQAFQAAVGRKFEERTIGPKSAEFDIAV